MLYTIILIKNIQKIIQILIFYKYKKYKNSCSEFLKLRFKVYEKLRFKEVTVEDTNACKVLTAYLLYHRSYGDK